MLIDTPEAFEIVSRLLAPLSINSVLDIGSSNRPQTLIKAPPRHVCADPCQEALDLLSDKYEKWHMPARAALMQSAPGDFDAIMLLDVIEHMEKDEGRDVLELCLSRNPRVIAVFTPLGFFPQKPEGQIGGELQRHRSGWTPDDFEGRWLHLLACHWCGVDPARGRTYQARAFFALWIGQPPCA